MALRFRIEPLTGTVEPFEAEKTITVPRVAFPRVGDRHPVSSTPTTATDGHTAWTSGIRSRRVRRVFELAGRVGTAPPAIAPAAPAPAAPVAVV